MKPESMGVRERPQRVCRRGDGNISEKSALLYIFRITCPCGSHGPLEKERTRKLLMNGTPMRP